MSTSITVRRYLDKQDVPYSLIQCSVDEQGRWSGLSKDIAPTCVARAKVLKDNAGLVMAILPITHRLNLAALNHQLHRKLEAAAETDYRGIFADCAPGILPAIGEAYGFETVVDDSLLNQEYVYVASGNAGELIRLSGTDFQLLHSNAWYSHAFTQIAEKYVKSAAQKQKATAAQTTGDMESSLNVRQRIERITKLPAMPSMAQKIIQLNANPYAHAEDLAKLIEKDPSLTAQIVRYAQSPLYGYKGNVASVRQAISRVLGYDMVMNIALGIAAARPFKIPTDGPLGLMAFWRHAIYSAALTQALCKMVPRERMPSPGTAYLAGLLHNFGFLLLGHLFPTEFEALNKAIEQEPDTPVVDLEQRLLGITHMEIGAWLMESWQMPQEIVVVQQAHHNPEYDGPFANYVRLVALADSLLKGQDMGDAASPEPPANILEVLGIGDNDLAKAVEQASESQEILDAMVRQFVA